MHPDPLLRFCSFLEHVRVWSLWQRVLPRAFRVVDQQPGQIRQVPPVIHPLLNLDLKQLELKWLG